MADRALTSPDSSYKKSIPVAPEAAPAASSQMRTGFACEFDVNNYDLPGDPRPVLWRHRINYLRRIVRFSPAAHLLLLGEPLKGIVTWPWENLDIPLSPSDAPEEIDGLLDKGDITVVASSLSKCAVLDGRLAALPATPQKPSWYEPHSDMVFELALQPILGDLPRDVPDLSGIHPLIFPHFVVEGDNPRPAKEDEIGTPIALFLSKEFVRRKREYLKQVFEGGNRTMSYISELNIHLLAMEAEIRHIVLGFKNVCGNKYWADEDTMIRQHIFDTRMSRINKMEDQRHHILFGLIRLMDRQIIKEIISASRNDLEFFYKNTDPNFPHIPYKQNEDLMSVLHFIDQGSTSIRQAILEFAKSQDFIPVPGLPNKPYDALDKDQRRLWERKLYTRYTASITRALKTLSRSCMDPSHNEWRPTDLMRETVRAQIRALLST